jgi:hypothetical protein
MAKDIRDFYITYEGHPKFNSSEIVTDELVRVLINKIEMCLFTNKGEFIGDPDFGCNIPKYLWESNLSVEFIRNEINTQFIKYIPELINYNYTLDVFITEGTFRDVMIINISINQYTVNAIFR